MSIGFEFIKYQPFKEQAFQPSITFIKNKKILKSVFYLTSELPTTVLEKISKIPGIASPKLSSNIKVLKMANKKVNDLYTLFEHFTTGEWIFETKKIYEYLSELSEEERILFQADPKAVDWKVGIPLYGYGAQKFLMNMDPILPMKQTQPLIRKNHFEYFEDIKYAFLSRPIVTVDIEQLRKDALNS